VHPHIDQIVIRQNGKEYRRIEDIEVPQNSKVKYMNFAAM
jgi:hypothetical protein